MVLVRQASQSPCTPKNQARCSVVSIQVEGAGSQDPRKEHKPPQPLVSRSGTKTALPRLDELPPTIVYNQRLRLVQTDAERLVNDLNMAAFRRLFQAQGNYVDLPQFIRIVQKIANRADTGGNGKGLELLEGLSEEEVTSRLMELFREIDLDGDGKIVWEEFTRFILDKATQVGKKASGLHKANDVRQDAPYLPVNRPAVIPPHLARHKFPYERIACLPDRIIPLLATVEHESPVVQFFNIQQSTLPPVGCIRSKGKILAMVDMPWPISTFATSDSDLCMRTWHLDDTPSMARKWSMKQQWSVAKNQYSLCYNPNQKLLFSGDSSDITAWHMPDNAMKLRFSQAHTGTIFSLLSLTELDAVVSGSADSNVHIWDIHKEQLVQRLTAHKKGVLALGYCASQRLLVSGGYDHEPCVWNPFVNMMLHRLVGHSAPVTAVEGLDSRPEIVTGDANGVVKIWDLRTYKCIQSFQADGSGTGHKQDANHDSNDGNADDQEEGTKQGAGGVGKGHKGDNGIAGSLIDALGLGYDAGQTGQVSGIVQVQLSSNLSRMVVATTRLNVLSQTYVKPDDDLSIACACYNEECLTIITAAGSTIRVWDALYGSLKATYADISKHGDISAMCLDDRRRKILFGNLGGHVAVIAHQSGTFMKSFRTETDATVVSVSYAGKAATGKQVVVAFTDRRIRVFDEAPLANCPLLRVIEWDGAAKGLYDLSSISLFPHLFNGRGPYVAAACGPTVGLVNYSSGRCEALVTAVRGDEDEIGDSSVGGRSLVVLAVTFLGDSPLMALSCNDGYIQIWSVWPILGSRRGCIFRFSNEEPRGYTYDGEEDEPYPLLRPRGVGAKPTYPTNRPSLYDNRRQSIVPKIPKEPEKREWRKKPRFDSPRRKTAIPVTCLAWDPKDTNLYVGDESGRIRCWDLTSVYDCLEEHHLLVHTGAWRTRSLRPKKGRSMEEQLQFLTDDIDAYLAWSLEAHDDAITCLSLVPDPRAIISGSSDLYVKMWGINGRPYGRLVQSMPMGAKSPDWDLDIDVKKRAKKDAAVLSKVEEQMMMESMDGTEREQRSSLSSRPRQGNSRRHQRKGSRASREYSAPLSVRNPDAYHRVLTRLAKMDTGRRRARIPRVEPVPSLSSDLSTTKAEREIKRLWFKAAVSKPWHEDVLRDEDLADKPNNTPVLPQLLKALDSFEEHSRFKGAGTQSLFSTTAPLRTSMGFNKITGQPLTQRISTQTTTALPAVRGARKPADVLAEDERLLFPRNKPWRAAHLMRQASHAPTSPTSVATTTATSENLATMKGGKTRRSVGAQGAEAWYMPSWAVKQRREHEDKGAEGKERTQALKAATTAGPLPGLTTKASKKSEREEEEENDAISMAVADSEERRARRMRHKEQRARVRANMMATAMTATAGHKSPVSSPRIMSGHVTIKQAAQGVKTIRGLLPLPTLQATKTSTSLLKTSRAGKSPRGTSPRRKSPRGKSPRRKSPRKDTHELTLTTTQLDPGSPEDTPREEMSETSRGALRSTTRAGDTDILDDTDLEWGTLLSQRGNMEAMGSGLGGDTDLMSHTSTAVIRAGPRFDTRDCCHDSHDTCTGMGCEGVVRITIAGPLY